MSIFTHQNSVVLKGLKLGSEWPQGHLGPGSAALTYFSAF